MISTRIVIVAAMCLVFTTGCGRTPTVDGERDRLTPTAVTGSGGVVVCEDSIATEVGIGVLRRGGSAVDAAVATALTLAVTLPKAGNIGGGGFMVVYDAVDEAYWALDFRETAPAAATADMYGKRAAAGDAKASTLGALAGAIPGTVAGLYAAWEKGGYIDWRELVIPAAALAAGGFTVGDTLAWDIDRKSKDLGRYPSTRDVFFRNGSPIASGDRLVQSDLGSVLRTIADQGPAPFYRGDIAARMIAAVRLAGGIWAAEDLASYEPIFREPARIELDGRTTLVTMPPPSSASAVFAQTAALLRAQDAFERPANDPQRTVAFVEALRIAFADRNRQLGDPDHMHIDPEVLLTTEYLATRIQQLPLKPPGNSKSLGEADTLRESSDTTHIVVMDGRGGVVSLTTTLNASFGSKFVIPGTGIMLNNEMDDFDTQPGKPNLYGLVGTGVNKVTPRARMLSSMAPTIVERDRRPWMAIGARGGPRILTAVFQVVWRRAFDGADLTEAMAAPRVHHQWLPDRVYFERCCPQDDGRDALQAMGYVIDYKAQLARVIAAERLPDGRFVGVVDSRVGGLPRTVAE